MAVSANDLGKLINQDKPYVHSNINNFHAIHAQSLLRAKGENRLQNILKALGTVKENLKKQSDIFLGGLTPKQFLKEYYFGTGEQGEKAFLYYEAFIMYFRTPSFYHSLLSVAGYNIDNILKELDPNAEELGLISAKKVAEEMTSKVFDVKEKGSGGRRISKNDKGNIKIFENLTNSKLKKVLVTFFKEHSGMAYTYLIKELTEVIKKNMKSSNQVFEKTKELLDVEGKDFIKNYVSSKQQWDEKVYQKYLKMFTHHLRKALNNLEISSSQHLSGAIGEQFEVSILKATSGLDFGLSITGNWNEIYTRKVLINTMEEIPVVDEEGKNLKGSHDNQKQAQKGGNESWKDLSKQSYSDFTLVNPKNGMTARVQSKYYQGVIEKYKKNEQNINQHINLFEATANESIVDFIDNLQSKGQVFEDVDPNAIAYVLANSLWFANAGTLDSKNTEPQKVSMDNRAIFQEIGSGIGNFLGIVVDEQLTPILEFSNLFFLINNEVLLPTWVIIEELIEVIKQNQFDSKMANFSVNKGEALSFSMGATSFKEAKAKAVAGDKLSYQKKDGSISKYKGVFFHNGGYANSKLVDVGTAMGGEIMSNTKIQMRNINLNIDYERAIKSAYNLFK